jgi:hypothetical protein
MTVSSYWIWLLDLARQLVMAPGRDRVQDGVEAALASGTVSGARIAGAALAARRARAGR